VALQAVPCRGVPTANAPLAQRGIGRFGDLSVPHSARVNAAQAAMLAIASCSLILAALFAERQRYEATLQKALAHQRALNAELDHRVKNVLATVCSIISQTQQGSTSHADFLARLDSRIRSLARTHELLSSNTWRGVELAKIVERELAPHSSDRCSVGGPKVTLKAEAAQALAMVLHELSTNAAKYGAFTRETGRLSLRWWKQKGHLAILWQESAGPLVVPPTHPSYGTSLICELLPYELGGTVTLIFAPDGITCRLEVPQLWVSWENSIAEEPPV
jgi:two-component sensor histidine kinase